MKNFLCFAFCAALVPLAHAADDTAFYLSGALATRGTIKLTQNGISESDRSGLAFNLAGGYQFNQHLALEAGYARFGGFKFSGGREVDLDALYVAAKGSYAFGESFSVFGKLGVARHRNDVSNVGSTSDVRALLGVGMEYKITDKVGVSFGVTDYGQTRTRLGKYRPRQAELGLKISF